LNYLKDKIAKKAAPTSKKLKKSIEKKQHFLKGNAKFLKQVKEPSYPFESRPNRKKIRIQEFMSDKFNKENQ